jgi:hypothetical protein
MDISESRFIETTSSDATAAGGADKKLREAALKKFRLQRLSIAAGDGKAAAKVAESLRALFADTGVLEDLVRTAFTVNYEGTGRALFSVVQEVMLTDADIDAARELGMLATAPASLEARRTAALEAVGDAIEQLGM